MRIPNPDDPEIWGWWSGDENMVTVAGSTAVDVWGNRMNSQVDKTAKVASSNFWAWAPATVWRPVYTRADNQGNLLSYTNTILNADWGTTSCTKNSATTCTFTALNGRITQGNTFTRPGVTYRFRVKIRRISGNTALQLYHINSPTGTATNITIDGVLTEYSTTFVGQNSGPPVTVGLRDPNAAGWGQVEVTEWQLTEVGWDTTYVENSGAQKIFAAIDGKRCIITYETDACLTMDTSGLGGPPAIPGPLTVYLLWRPHVRAFAGYLYGSITPAGEILCDLNSTDESLFVNRAPSTRIDRGVATVYDVWRITTAVFNGYASYLRLDKDWFKRGTLGIPNPLTGGFYLGGNPISGKMQGMAIYEFIVRTTADSTATQKAYIRYLADRVGLVL
jgi:hypothetical protein